MNSNIFSEKQSTPLVSIGIPTYNRAEGLRRTLEYFTCQTYRNLEIIISDNASPDKAIVDIVSHFTAKDSRIKFFQQQTNIGAAFNFQFVLKKATGDFFMWAADDDEWKENFIESCLNGFRKETILVCTRMETHWRKSGKIEPILIPSLSEDMSAYERIGAFLNCPAPSMFYGLYDRLKLLNIFEFKDSFDFYDCAMLLRILSMSSVPIIQDVLYRAGIDDSQYIVKPYRLKKKSNLTYFPFVKYSFKTIANCNISLSLKADLWMQIIKFIIQNYLHHEKYFSKESLSGLLKYKISVYFYGILQSFKK